MAYALDVEKQAHDVAMAILKIAHHLASDLQKVVGHLSEGAQITPKPMGNFSDLSTLLALAEQAQRVALLARSPGFNDPVQTKKD